MPDQRPTTVVNGGCSSWKDKPGQEGACEGLNVRAVVVEPPAQAGPTVLAAQAGQRPLSGGRFRRLVSARTAWAPRNGWSNAARSSFVLLGRTRSVATDPAGGPAHV